MKLSRTNQSLEELLGKAEIKEFLSPGSAIRILPPEKELCRLAHLSGKLCALLRKSRKDAVKISSAKKVSSRRGKEPIRYGVNVAARKAQLRTDGCSKSFSALCENGHEEGFLRSR